MALTQHHFNQLSEDEAERLSLLAEECAEVIKAVMKIQRHGYLSFNPYRPDGGTNQQMLETEIGHVQHAIQRMLAAEDIADHNLMLSRKSKAITIKQYLHHQEDHPCA